MINLKLLRKNAKLTQQELADKMNLSLRGYQAIENEINQTSYDNLIKLSNMFGCSIDYLLGHTTQGVIHINNFTKSQQKAISMIKQLDDDQMLLLLGYLARMTDTPLDAILEE